MGSLVDAGARRKNLSLATKRRASDELASVPWRRYQLALGLTPPTPS